MQLNDSSTAEDIWLAKNLPGNMYLGGADTVRISEPRASPSLLTIHKTACALQKFFLVMALYPEVQRAAHAEIDAVLGQSRLPDLSDEDRLPYVGAVLKEVLRWHPVVPLGGYIR
jgi:hypothetical protein